MGKRLYIVASCTKTKRGTPKPDHESGFVFTGNISERFANWSLWLQGTGGRVAAASLYGGPLWHQVQQLRPLAEGMGYTASLWVVSAGYGLVAEDSPLRPYAATFATGQPDSVGATLEECRQWWQALTRWSGPAPGQPRSFADLVARDPGASYLIIAAPSYLNVVAADLEDATALLQRPDSLMIVSAGSKRTGPLAPFLVPADGRLQACFGGSLHTLNPLIGGYILERAAGKPLVNRDLSRQLEILLEAQPPISNPRRTVLDNQQVSAFIKQALTQEPDKGHTPFLRKLRADGFACEQKRFANLYHQIKEVAV